MLGLYLHIPFCSSICNYCNFNRGLFEPGLKDRYVAALAREITTGGRGEGVDTIFFGGGTPRSSNLKKSRAWWTRAAARSLSQPMRR